MKCESCSSEDNVTYRKDGQLVIACTVCKKILAYLQDHREVRETKVFQDDTWEEHLGEK